MAERRAGFRPRQRRAEWLHWKCVHGLDAVDVGDMSQARNEAITQETKQHIAELRALGFYHTIELPDGGVIPGLLSVERLRNRLTQFDIPADLRGKRVLDIGAWDGFYTFEMERRGAHVVALDLFRNEKFLLARDLSEIQSGIRGGRYLPLVVEGSGKF